MHPATGRTSGRRWPRSARPGGRAIAAACHDARSLGHRLARPRRRPGQQRVQPARAVGAQSRARGEQPRGAEVDGGRRHRRRGRPASPTPPPSPSTPVATAWRSTPASTAWCASSCRGLTNHRGDEWGHRPHAVRPSGRSDAVRPRAGDAVVGLRLCATSWHRGPASPPSMAPAIAAEPGGRGHRLRGGGARFDLLRREDPGRLPRAGRLQLDSAPRGAVGRARRPVFLQGSSSTSPRPSGRSTDGVCDGVEITRAPDRRPRPRRQAATAVSADRIRPCIRCNQTCQVRDVRNPIVTCVGEPSTGHETDDPDWYAAAATPRRVASSAAAWPGSRPRASPPCAATRALVERSDHLGGMAASPGRTVRWCAGSRRRCGRPRASVVRRNVADERHARRRGGAVHRRPRGVRLRGGDGVRGVDVSGFGTRRPAVPPCRRRRRRAVRPDRRAHRRRPGRGAGRPCGPRHAGPDRRQRAVAHRRPRPRQHPPAQPACASSADRWYGPSASHRRPAERPQRLKPTTAPERWRSSWTTASRERTRTMDAWRSSTAGSACPPCPSPRPTHRQATAWPREPSTKPCSRAAGVAQWL